MDEENKIWVEMPAYCKNCGEWFSSNDGVSSEKWLPKYIICQTCGDAEKREIELEESAQTAQTIAHAIIDLKHDFKSFRNRLSADKQILQKIEHHINKLDEMFELFDNLEF